MFPIFVRAFREYYGDDAAENIAIKGENAEQDEEAVALV